jgi:hypothetical protein
MIRVLVKQKGGKREFTPFRDLPVSSSFFSAFDLYGFAAFRALTYFELNSLAFTQSPITFANDICIMHENITGPVLVLDETVALLTIEPLYPTVSLQISSFQALIPSRYPQRISNLVNLYG